MNGTWSRTPLFVVSMMAFVALLAGCTGQAARSPLGVVASDEAVENVVAGLAEGAAAPAAEHQVAAVEAAAGDAAPAVETQVAAVEAAAGDAAAAQHQAAAVGAAEAGSQIDVAGVVAAEPAGDAGQGASAGTGDTVGQDVWQRATSLLSPGKDTDGSGLLAAEAGQLGVPSLVFFHADWCHVCQEIRPDVEDMAVSYDGRAALIRMNVDSAESHDAMRRYGVRGTPTFVVLNGDGEVLDRVGGWPGADRLVAAIDRGVSAN